MVTERRKARMEEVLANRQTDLTLVCENIHDRHNVSAIFRSCDAVRIPEVHLFYHIEKFPKIGNKSSSSAKKWIDIHQHCDPDSLKNALKNKGLKIYTTHLSEEAVSIYDVDWTRPSAIILGNEHRGVSPLALEIADQNVYIPMFGMIQSLNVSVAAAVILYEIGRQRILKGCYPNPRLTPDIREDWLNDWLER